MKRLSLVVISLVIFLCRAIAQEHAHDHAHNNHSSNNYLLGEYSKEPIPLKNGFFKVLESGKWKILNKDKKPLSDKLYDGVGNSSFSVLPVYIGKKWGLLNDEGIQILDNRFDLIANFTTTVSAAKMGNKWFLINNKGQIIKPLYIDYFGGFINNKAKVFKEDKIAFIDLKGDILPPGWVKEKPKQSSVLIPQNNIAARSFPCPPNITFENGNFSGWECFVGHVLTRNPTTGCICTDNENYFTVNINPSWPGTCTGCKNVMQMNPATPVVPDPNRHLIYDNTTLPPLDDYGLFPIAPPDGSRFAVKLGNDRPFLRSGTPSAWANARVERVRYKIKVPKNASEFFVVFQYAVVFEQFDGHEEEDHPRFTARLIDPITNKADPCADFDFNAFNPDGFTYSPYFSPNGFRMLYKPWDRVYVNLSKYADKEVY
ncbi:MAG: hypothetical protein ACK5BV_07125, partial [Bacteroidota bacterium]